MSPPEDVVSGVPVQVSYPTFPNVRELVFDADNTERLKALLPALQKYNCLESPVFKTARSPWVRAFCDLYHPAGPWGPFRNTPAMDSKMRYQFKPKIKAIYAQLEKFYKDTRDGTAVVSCPVRLELHTALTTYYDKLSYHKEFMAACQEICLAEVAKPHETRAPIPSSMVDLADDGSPVEATTMDQNATMEAANGRDSSRLETTGKNPVETTPMEQSSTTKVVDDDGDDNDHLATITQDTTNEDADPPTMETIGSQSNDSDPSSAQEALPVVGDQPPDAREEQDDVSFTSSNGRKRELFRDSPPTKKARTGFDVSNDDNMEDDDDDEATHCFDVPSVTMTPHASFHGVPPTGCPEEVATSNLVTPKSTTSIEDDIQAKRTKLEGLLSIRTKNKNPAEDSLCKKIQLKIDELDEELFELINSY